MNPLCSQFVPRALPFLCAVLTAGSSLAFGQNPLQQQTSEQTTSNAPMLYGRMETPARHFRFALLMEEGTPQELQSFDEGRAKFKLSDVKLTERELSFSLATTGAVYRGQSAGSGKPYEGFWEQRGTKIPLNFAYTTSAPEEAETAWQGTMSILFQKLAVRIREYDDGRAYFDSLSQRVGGFVAEVNWDDEGQVQISVPAVKGNFEGKLNEAGDELSGKWKQGVYSAELVLQKTEPEEAISAVPNRPQHPKPPYPYQVTEVQFPGGAEGVTLAGTITMPRDLNGRAVPGVVLVTGSGPQNRDEEIADHKPFLVLADYLTRHGIAVLRYDDRGVAESTGTFATATIADLADDAEAAFEFLKKTNGVNPDLVGICGHSEGGITAPMVAARNEHIAFVILMAGTGVTGGEISKSQTRLLLEASGAPPAAVESSVKVQEILVDLAMAEPPLSEAEYVRQAKEQIVELLPSVEAKQQVDTMVQSAYEQLCASSAAFYIRHDPQGDLEKLRCSVLALNGEKDVQVDADLNFPAIERALTKAPTEDFRLVRFPGLNHLFQKCQTGLIDEYGRIEETIHEPVLELIATWIGERARP